MVKEWWQTAIHNEKLRLKGEEKRKQHIARTKEQEEKRTLDRWVTMVTKKEVCEYIQSSKNLRELNEIIALAQDRIENVGIHNAREHPEQQRL